MGMFDDIEPATPRGLSPDCECCGQPLHALVVSSPCGCPDCTRVH